MSEIDFGKLFSGENGIPPEMLDKLILSGVVLVVFAVLRSIAGWIAGRRITDVKARYRTGKIATYTITVLGLFFLGSIWFTGFRNVSTYLGLVSAGLAIALKDMLASIAGWFYILARRPFEVGDRIAIGEHAGDVIDQRLFRFSMLEIGNWVASDQSTGRVIHIPNSMVFTSTSMPISCMPRTISRHCLSVTLARSALKNRPSRWS